MQFLEAGVGQSGAEPRASLRSRSWYFVRNDDGTAEVWGPVELGMPRRQLLQWDGDEIVGGTVMSDAGDVPVSLAVLKSGEIVRFDGARRSRIPFSSGGISGFLGVGGPVAAAVGRTITVTGGMQRSSVPGTSEQLPRTDTLVIAQRQDGQIIPIAVGSGHGTPQLPVQVLEPLSSLDGSMLLLPDDERPLLDADASCVRVPSSAANFISATGPVSTYLGCPVSLQGSLSVGRISVAVSRSTLPSFPPAVEAGPGVIGVTAGDVVNEDLRTVGREYLAWLGCRFGTTGSVQPGSFDVRVVAGVTHLGCVEARGDRIAVASYHQPRSATPIVQPLPPIGDPRYLTTLVQRAALVRSFDDVTPLPVQRTVVDPLFVPGVGDPRIARPDRSETYSTIGGPTVQLQFPCAVLTGRRTNTGTVLDDCDPSTEGATGDGQLGGAGAPKNWVSYTVAGYGTVGSERRLFITTAPETAFPPEPFLLGDPPSADALPREASPFSFTVEPEHLFGSDLEVLRSPTFVPPASGILPFPRYEVPSSPPPLLLANMPRSGRNNVLIEISADTIPTRTPVSAEPIAVLLAPPIVAGLGQSTSTAPQFAASKSTGQTTANGRSTSLGAVLETEATFTGGGGIIYKQLAGAGVSVDVSFVSEVEKSLSRTRATEQAQVSEGSFDDHVVVMRSRVEWVWPGRIVHDPSGFATGDDFVWRDPIADSTSVSSVPLRQLVEENPELFGPAGVFGAGLRRIVGRVEIGDPGSYPSFGSRGSAPGGGRQIYLSNGGACRSPRVPGRLVAFEGQLPAAVDVTDNPFISADAPPPIGKEDVISSPFLVTVGNSGGNGPTISLSSEESRSLLATKSVDATFSLIAKLQGEFDIGIAKGKWEGQIKAGVASGWSWSSGVEDTLGEGTELSAIVGNIPRPSVMDGVDGPNWIDREGYTWRMYLCKARLGSIGAGIDVWVQGYLVDGYVGKGGIEAFDTPVAISPEQSTVVPWEASDATSAAPYSCDAAADRRALRFRWSHPQGATREYRVEYRLASTGSQTVLVLPQLSEPPRRADSRTLRRTCAQIPSGELVEGALYDWRVTAVPFVGSPVSSEWRRLRPQVWPSTQRIDVRPLTANADGTVSVDVEYPSTIRSLEATIRVVQVSTGTVVIERRVTGSSYRTAPLPGGSYRVEVFATNDTVDADGGRVTTPTVVDVVTVTSSTATVLPPPSPPTSTFSGAPRQPRGYRIVETDGPVYGFGSASSDVGVRGPAVAIAEAPDEGFWVLRGDGVVAARNGARHFGNVDTSLLDPGERPSTISGVPDGSGYWVFTTRGRALTFGSARSFGDMSGVRLNGSVVASVPTVTGKGYWMIGSDGGVFSFGDATFHGSMGGRRLNQPVVGIAPDPDGVGYWLVAADGGIFAFDAAFRGSVPSVLQREQRLNKPIVGAVAYGEGYLLVGADGGVFDFSGLSLFFGSLGSNPPGTPVVGVAPMR